MMGEIRKARVLLADDHKIVLEGLRGLLQDEYELVGMATDGMELVAMACRLQPDVIVADISMPLLNGVDAVRKLREEGVRCPVVMLRMLSMRAALSKGARWAMC